MDDALRDPIDFELFVDPVTTPYGHTFSRRTIERCLDAKPSCPITHQPLQKKDLIPNFVLRDVVEAYAAERNGGNENDDTQRRKPGKGVLESLGEEKRRLLMAKVKRDHQTARLASIDAQLESMPRTRTELAERLQALQEELSALKQSQDVDAHTLMEKEEIVEQVSSDERHLDKRQTELETQRTELELQAEDQSAMVSSLSSAYDKLYMEAMTMFQEVEEMSIEHDEKERLQRLDLATEVKEKGNRMYSKKEYQEAVELYSQAIEMYEPFVNGFFHLNRCAAYTKLNMLREALADCHTVLLLFHWNPDTLAPFKEGSGGGSESSSKTGPGASSSSTASTTQLLSTEDRNMLSKALRRMAEAYLQDGRKKDALAPLLRALDLNENDKHAKKLLETIQA